MALFSSGQPQALNVFQDHMFATVRYSRSGAFRVAHLEFQVSNLPPELQGYTMVHLTDLHYGPATGKKRVEQAVSLAQSFKPNVFLITGDCVVAGLTGLRHKLATEIHPGIFCWKHYRRTVRHLCKELAEMLKTLNAPDGVLGCFGNHDHIEGFTTVERQLRPAIRWMRNESISIHRGEHQLVISAVDDVKRGKPDLKKTFDDNHSPVIRILLSHNPDIVLCDKSNLLHRSNLILCGHTHGGQICIPGWGPLRTCTKQKAFVSGLNRHNGSWIYTNSGVGQVGIPLRLFCPPEVAVIRLQAPVHNIHLDSN